VRRLLEDPGGGAAGLRCERGWLRGYAGACASIVERAEKGDSLEAAASFEATRLARSAPPKEKKNQWAVVVGFSRFVRRTAPTLAA
jgi:hypothetical protein